MATINPDFDWYEEDKRIEALEQEREMRHKCLLQDKDFITNTLTEDEVPEIVIDVVAAQLGRVTVTQDYDAAYRTIGRVVAEWITESAWKASKK